MPSDDGVPKFTCGGSLIRNNVVVTAGKLHVQCIMKSTTILYIHSHDYSLLVAAAHCIVGSFVQQMVVNFTRFYLWYSMYYARYTMSLDGKSPI